MRDLYYKSNLTAHDVVSPMATRPYLGLAELTTSKLTLELLKFPDRQLWWYAKLT